MPEESHLEEMREAIRGDFERLAERRGDQELLRADEHEDPEPGEPEREDAEPDVETERRSWLMRLLSP